MKELKARTATSIEAVKAVLRWLEEIEFILFSSPLDFFSAYFRSDTFGISSCDGTPTVIE